MYGINGLCLCLIVNDPFVRDRQANILTSVVNGWRRDLLPGPSILPRDAMSLLWKFLYEALDVIKEHSSKTIANVVPFQWLKNGKLIVITQ